MTWIVQILSIKLQLMRSINRMALSDLWWNDRKCNELYPNPISPIHIFEEKNPHQFMVLRRRSDLVIFTITLDGFLTLLILRFITSTPKSPASAFSFLHRQSIISILRSTHPSGSDRGSQRDVEFVWSEIGYTSQGWSRPRIQYCRGWRWGTHLHLPHPPRRCRRLIRQRSKGWYPSPGEWYKPSNCQPSICCHRTPGCSWSICSLNPPIPSKR